MYSSIGTLILFICHVASDPCPVKDTTWVRDIVDILEDIPDYKTCQDTCAELGNAQCNFFTWYSEQHQDNPLTCVFFLSTSWDIRCENCISGPSDCPTQDLIFIGDSLVLELPSFAPAICNPAPYPEIGIQYAVSGSADGHSIVCGGRNANGTLLSSCFSLQGGTWQMKASLATARSGAAASRTAGGLLVTEGYGAQGYLASTEIFTENSWIAGPALPAATMGHCQVQIGDTVIVVGE